MNLIASISFESHRLSCTNERVRTVCAVCENDFYPSGSFECLECSEGNAANAMITIM